MFGELLTPMHMIFILAIVLIVFGPKRLPDIGRSLGNGIKEFRKSAGEIQESVSMDDLKVKAATEPAASAQKAAETTAEVAHQQAGTEAKD